MFNGTDASGDAAVYMLGALFERTDKDDKFLFLLFLSELAQQRRDSLKRACHLEYMQ